MPNALMTLALAPIVLASMAAGGTTATPTPPPAKGLQAASTKNPVYTGDIIVKFKSADGSKRAAALAKAGAKVQGNLTVKREMASSHTVLVKGDKKKVAATVAALQSDPAVATAEPDLLMQPLGTATDPYFGSYQWDLTNATGGMNATGAWDSSLGANTTVAVLDTGITSHPDLTPNLVAGYDFISNLTTANDGTARDADPSDPGDATAANQCGANTPAENSSWHGTHVAGTVAAVKDNGQGIAGVAPAAKIMPVRVLGTCGGSLSDIADAITWASGGSITGVPAAAKRADVLNLSLGGAGTCYSYIQSAIDGAVSRGVPVVVAAGNENMDAVNSAPANCANVITVGATSPTGGKSSFSNYGSRVTLSAPGGENSSSINTFIVSTGNSGTTTPGAANYLGMIGTSQATPHVAGTIALMKAVNPTITPQQAKDTLVTTVKPFGSTPAVPMGAGILDAGQAVTAARTLGTPTPTPTPTPSPTTTTAPTAAPVLTKDSLRLGATVKTYKFNQLANDKLTASVASVTLSGAPNSTALKVTVNADKTLQITKSTRYRGTSTFTYTVKQSDGQTASTTVTLTV